MKFVVYGTVGNRSMQRLLETPWKDIAIECAMLYQPSEIYKWEKGTLGETIDNNDPIWSSKKEPSVE
jgi:hypothetical protein